MKSITLSEHFTNKKLISFTLPSIAMVIFSSVYFIADVFFVSNFVGKSAFAAVNLIMPYLMIISSVGFMLGTGGSAVISALRGMREQEKANRTFSLVVYTTIVTGVILTLAGLVALEPVCRLLGAQGELLENCLVYGQIVILALPFFMLQQEFQILYVAAEKPSLGFKMSLFSGLVNIVLDALFIIEFNMGLEGAAIATLISEIIAGVFPLWFFARPGRTALTLGRADLDFKVLLKICINGSSELFGEISMSIVAMLYNYQLMKYAGENGVVAYGVLMYLSFMFMGIFIGFTTGSSPVISYNFGAENHSEMRSLLSKSIKLILAVSAAMFALGEIFKGTLSEIFVGYDPELMKLTVQGFSIVSFSFLFSGLAIFSSGFFTALNNSLISAVISLQFKRAGKPTVLTVG